MKAVRSATALGLLAPLLSGLSGCSVVSTTVDVTTKAVRTGAEVTATVAGVGASVVSTGVKTAAAVGAAGATAASATVAAGAAARTAAAATASVAIHGTVALIDVAQRIEARERVDELVHLPLVSQGAGRYLAGDGRIVQSPDCSTPAGTPALWVMRRDGRNEVRIPPLPPASNATAGTPEPAPALRCKGARFVG
jgi:hypothetical protein